MGSQKNPERKKLFHRESTKLDCSETILELMQLLGMSRGQLASKMGISKKKLGRKLNDKVNLNFLCDAIVAMGYMVDIRVRPFKLGEYRPRIEGNSPENPDQMPGNT